MSAQAVVAAVVVGILVAEIYAWLPRIAERLVALAAGRLPEPARQRYLADWLGEIDARPGGVAKVVFAAQVFATAGSLLEELPPSSPEEPEGSASRSEPASPALVLPKPALPSAAAPMLQVAPQIRTLEAPDASLLDSFSTGTASWEQDIAEVAEELRHMLREDEFDSYEGRVAEVPASQPLIGVSLYGRRPLSSGEAFKHAVHVALLGLNRPYRHARMPDDVTRVDSLLLADALAQIACKWGRHTMPYVWTLVHCDHKEELALLTKHGFWHLRDISRDPSQPYRVLLRDEGCAWTHGFSPQIVKAVGTSAD